jgi:hypothetical protein
LSQSENKIIKQTRCQIPYAKSPASATLKSIALFLAGKLWLKILKRLNKKYPIISGHANLSQMAQKPE